MSSVRLRQKRIQTSSIISDSLEVGDYLINVNIDIFGESLEISLRRLQTSFKGRQ